MPEDDKIELLKSGKVSLHIDGKRYEWKRPSARQYRDLSEMSVEMGEKIPTGDKPEGESDAEWNMQILDASIEATADWFMKAHDLLGNKPLDVAEPRDLPAWILSAEFINRVLRHFTEVPLVAPGQ